MNIQQRVDAVRRASVEILEAHVEECTRVGLTVVHPHILVWKRHPDDYSAELSITFWRGDNVIDVIEFFVCEDGQMVGSDEEILGWVREELAQVLAEAAH